MSKDSVKAPHGGVQGVLEMLRLMPLEEQSRIMANLAERDPKLAQELRQKLPRFEDLINLLPAQVQGLVKRVPLYTLALALRGAEQKLQDHVFSNLTERTVDQLKEEVQTMGPQPMSRVEEAQRQVALQMQALLSQS